LEAKLGSYVMVQMWSLPKFIVRQLCFGGNRKFAEGGEVITNYEFGVRDGVGVPVWEPELGCTALMQM
jgi:hypothetical protein